MLTLIPLGFPHSSVGKEPACNAGDPGSIPGLGRSPGEVKGYPLQYSGLESQRVENDWVTFTFAFWSHGWHIVSARYPCCEVSPHVHTVLWKEVTELCCYSVAQSCPTVCDPMNCSMPGLPVLHYLLEFAHTHSRWCYPTISSSVIQFSSYLQSFPATGSFPMSWFSVSGGQSIGASALASGLTMDIQGWFPLELTGLIFLLFKGLRFFLVLTTLTVMSNAFVMYFVECPSIRIIPELSPPIRKGQNLLIFDSSNAIASSRSIQYFIFFFFSGGRYQVLAIFWAVYLDSWMGREHLFCT